MKPPVALCPMGLLLYVRKFTYTAQSVNPLTQKPWPPLGISPDWRLFSRGLSLLFCLHVLL